MVCILSSVPAVLRKTVSVAEVAMVQNGTR